MNLSQCIEKCLIQHCSPTLASLKTASMFTLEFTCRRELEDILKGWNTYLADKGVTMVKLQEKKGRALIYVFRMKQLQRNLNCPKVTQFLQKNGYAELGTEAAISTLKTHLNRFGEFPHEIGLFLGYPIEDVIGFIENKGKNCKRTGCWKVYYNESEAEKTFARYKKCETVYMRLWEQGRSVRQLTVAA